MAASVRRRLLFVLNVVSGAKTVDWRSVILGYFTQSPHDIGFYKLPENFTTQEVRLAIQSYQADYVIAVGGDGTVTLLSECLVNTTMSLGILPAGSANGMAKELGINTDPQKALDVIAAGFTRRISATIINGRTSIHLADVGLNAFMLKEFQSRGKRGYLGYTLATAKVLWKNRGVDVDLAYDGKHVRIKADIILIANATSYGTGVTVNPVGKLDDDVFEVIAIPNLSLGDVIKNSLQKSTIDRSKVKVFQMSEGTLTSKRPVHFQIDGEYLGKVKEVHAKLLPNCLQVIVPENVQ
ncbi:MAG TPA: diacylglycerol kinase family protein [Cyclobacteriaceae bacterium]|nr:diacylglycerol kinase family protein [Cyclobacteriaceae bacterium]